MHQPLTLERYLEERCMIFGEALTSCDIWLENGVVGSTLPLPLTLSSSSYHLTYMSEDGKHQTP